MPFTEWWLLSSHSVCIHVSVSSCEVVNVRQAERESIIRIAALWLGGGGTQEALTQAHVFLPSLYSSLHSTLSLPLSPLLTPLSPRRVWASALPCMGDSQREPG